MNERDIRAMMYLRKYCLQIINATSRFAGDYEAFCNDDIFYNAVAMMLLQIGEHSTRLSTEYTDSTEASVPWKSLRSLRNMLAHEYEVIVTRKLWVIITDEIPKLLAYCEKTLADHNTSPEPDDTSTWGSVRESLSGAPRLT